MSEIKYIKYNDNRRVQNSKWGAEFVKIVFRKPSDDYPYGIKLARYGVPGRCDRYAFSYITRARGGPIIQHWSETSETLVWAIQQVQKDLDRKNVAEMIRLSVTPELQHYARVLAGSVLASIAPKSLSLRVLRRELKKLETAQKADNEANKILTKTACIV